VVTPLAVAGETSPAQQVADRSPAVVQVDGKFTAEQSAELAAFLRSPEGRRSVAEHLGPLSSQPEGDVHTLVEGGQDGDHWWIKISMGDIASVGIATACKLAFPGVGWFVCPPIGAAIRAAMQQYPEAGGFWAELYNDGRVRVGTW
jgi:hypothetical protein